jgi:hypothetical protein
MQRSRRTARFHGWAIVQGLSIDTTVGRIDRRDAKPHIAVRLAGARTSPWVRMPVMTRKLHPTAGTTIRTFNCSRSRLAVFNARGLSFCAFQTCRAGVFLKIKTDEMRASEEAGLKMAAYQGTNMFLAIRT